MTDITAIIQSEFDKMSDDGDIEKAIRAKARETINGAINDAFRSYGSMGKQIEAAVKGALNLDFSKVDLDEYNVMIVQMVKRVAFEHLEERAQKTLSERLGELLGTAPKEMTIQGLVHKYIEEWKEGGCICAEYAHIEIEHHDWSTTSTTIKLWQEEPTGLYSSKMPPDLDIFISDQKILIPRMMATTWPSKHAFNLEADIYQMFCSGTIFTDAHDADAHDINTSYRDY